MIDFEARKVIEALRSGIPSKTIGQHFSHARPEILAQIGEMLDAKNSDAMVVLGKYGEGKTHLLNTVFNLAHTKNMAVSIVSLSKETPFNRFDLVYHKLALNTYLPGRLQPGFESLLENMSPNSTIATELLDFAKHKLESQKIDLLLNAYLNTDDHDSRFAIFSDFEGDFLTNVKLKNIYKDIFPGKISITTPFVKSKHTADYMRFLSKLFTSSGLNGWVLLFDETELIGQLGKKARMTAYGNMSKFLQGEIDDVFALFAISASFIEDVIHSKYEYDNILISPECEHKNIENTLNAIENAPQLSPLNKGEMMEVLSQIKIFHGRAYGWSPIIDTVELYNKADSSGFLLRSRIRVAIEILDQLYQYGESGLVTVSELRTENYEEEMPLPDLI